MPFNNNSAKTLNLATMLEFLKRGSFKTEKSTIVKNTQKSERFTLKLGGISAEVVKKKIKNLTERNLLV